MDVQALIARVVYRDPSEIAVRRAMLEQIADRAIELVLRGPQPRKLNTDKLRLWHVELVGENVEITHGNSILWRI